MAKFNLLEKTIRLSYFDIIKYQIHSYCYFNNIKISDSELLCLALLIKEYSLIEFIELVVNKKIFKSSQVVRNTISRLTKYGLIEKKGSFRQRRIVLSDNLNVQKKDNILLNYKILYINEKNTC